MFQPRLDRLLAVKNAPDACFGKENRILWINAIANRMPTASSKDMSRIFKKLKSFTEPVREVEPNIFVLNPLAIPAYGSKVIVDLNQRSLVRQVKKAMRNLGFSNIVNMVFNPAAGMIAGRCLGESELIYYCVDEYTAFTGSSALKEIEERLFRMADLVVVSAEKVVLIRKSSSTKTRILSATAPIGGIFGRRSDPRDT